MSVGRTPDRQRTGAVLLAIAAATALLWSCSTDSGEKRSLTQRERDSTIAASPLPGAGTVGKALEVSDSAAARSHRSLPDAP